MAVDFNQLTPGQLAKAAVLPQSLDNQWVPTRILNRMMKKGFCLNDVKDKRDKYVLKEWRRALVYGEQVVVNRAFIFNNDIVVDDYDDSENRAALKQMLARGDVVLYLFTEDSPDEKPRFDVKPALWNSWMDIVNDTRLSCVRLDWEEQDDDFERLSKTYHRYIQTLNTRTESFMANFDIPKKHHLDLQKRLREVVDYASDKADQGKSITRNDIYERFVCVDGDDPNIVANGCYANKKRKPFADVIKLIADLKYNVNLPDALGRYALTPEDSPQRSVLGDLQDALQVQAITDDNIEEIIYALRRLAFDQVAPGLYIRSLGALTLNDVLKVREGSDDSREWAEYRDALHQLLDHPLNFAENSRKLYRKIVKLNKAITRQRYETKKDKWSPWVKFSIAVGTSLIELWLNPANPQDKFITKVVGGAVSTGLSPFLMRMTITALSEAEADLDASLDFFRGTVRNGRDTWKEIENKLQETKGYTLLEKATLKKTAEDANVSSPESF